MNATAAIVPGPDDLHAGFRFYGTKSRCACKGGIRILQVLKTDCNPTALQLVGPPPFSVDSILQALEIKSFNLNCTDLPRRKELSGLRSEEDVDSLDMCRTLTYSCCCLSRQSLTSKWFWLRDFVDPSL